MATADEIFAAELGADDVWFEVDLTSRQIIVPKAVTNLGVKSDADVMHVRFKLPRFYYGVDFSECKIGIDYTNAKGEEDRYEPKDVTVSGSVVTFTWIIGRHAALYNGNVTFGLCVKRLNPADPDDPFNELHTTKASLPILDGMETCEEAIVMHTDLLEQWREQLFGEKDSLIADLNAASQNEQAAIQDKGVEVLASIPKDYAETFSMINHADRTKADAILCSAEGDSIYIADASDDHIRNLRILGKTMQLRTTGVQLFDAAKITDLTTNGVTMKNDGLGRIVLYGTATAAFSSVNIRINDLTPGIYSLSGEIPGKVFFYVRVTLADGTFEYYKAPNVFTLDGTETEILGYLYAPQGGVSFNWDVVYPMLNVGDVALPWEPYSNGVASPSPECPQDLVSIENPTAYIFGKNLLKTVAATQTLNGVTFTVRDDGSFYAKGTATSAAYFGINYDIVGLVPGRMYYLTGCPFGGSGNAYRLYAQTNDGTRFAGDVGHGTKFTATADQWQVLFVVYSGATVDFEVKPMLRDIACDDSSYEPHVLRQEITVPYTLRAIPVTEDGNYVDANGQHWICDEIDFERGVYVQRIGQMVLNNDHTYYYNADTPGKEFFYTADNNNAKAWELRMACSHFPVIGGKVSMDSDYWTQFSGSGGIRFRHKDLTSLDELAAWLVENPVIICYVLATPIEMPLTSAEIETFKAMRTNFANTVVSNNTGAWMALKYNADTRTYLDRLPKATDAQVQSAVNAWLEAHFTNAEGVSF